MYVARIVYILTVWSNVFFLPARVIRNKIIASRHLPETPTQACYHLAAAIVLNLANLWLARNKCIHYYYYYYVGRRTMEMKVQVRRNRGRPKRRWLDSVRDDIKEKGLSADDVYDHATWRCMSSYIEEDLCHTIETYFCNIFLRGHCHACFYRLRPPDWQLPILLKNWL